MVLNVCFCDPPFLYRIFTEKVFCRKDYLFFGLKTDLVDVIFLNSFHNRNNNLFEFIFEIEYNQVAWFILEKKMHSNNLVRYTIRRIHDMTGNISQLSQTNPTCFFAHIKFLNWSYFITYGCGLDEISALEIIFNNLLLQHWGQILSEVEFYIVVSSRVSYNYCFKVGRYFNDYYFICQN